MANIVVMYIIRTKKKNKRISHGKEVSINHSYCIKPLELNVLLVFLLLVCFFPFFSDSSALFCHFTANLPFPTTKTTFSNHLIQPLFST